MDDSIKKCPDCGGDMIPDYVTEYWECKECAHGRRMTLDEMDAKRDHDQEAEIGDMTMDDIDNLTE